MKKYSVNVVGTFRNWSWESEYKRMWFEVVADNQEQAEAEALSLATEEAPIKDWELEVWSCKEL